MLLSLSPTSFLTAWEARSAISLTSLAPKSIFYFRKSVPSFPFFEKKLKPFWIMFSSYGFLMSKFSYKWTGWYCWF